MAPDDSQLDLATVAGMIGQTARAAMLDALMSGRWLTATELAEAAGVSPSTGSEHLNRLVEGGLVLRRRSGRHIYHALSGPDVAEALEGLGRVAFRAGQRNRVPDALRFARSCYDHLAGGLGVFLADVLRAEDVVAASGSELSAGGAAWLHERLGIRIDGPSVGRRDVVRPCLDWSERRDHLAGTLGAVLLATMLERRWLRHVAGSRALHLTVRGRDRLEVALGREMPVPEIDRPVRAQKP